MRQWSQWVRTCWPSNLNCASKLHGRRLSLRCTGGNADPHLLGPRWWQASRGTACWGARTSGSWCPWLIWIARSSAQRRSYRGRLRDYWSGCGLGHGLALCLPTTVLSPQHRPGLPYKSACSWSLHLKSWPWYPSAATPRGRPLCRLQSCSHFQVDFFGWTVPPEVCQGLVHHPWSLCSLAAQLRIAFCPHSNRTSSCTGKAPSWWGWSKRGYSKWSRWPGQSPLEPSSRLFRSLPIVANKKTFDLNSIEFSIK